jgi:hypothetical protein
MGKIFDTQTYLRIKLSYTADVADNISTVKIKYEDADGETGEWEAVHVPAEKYVYYDLVAGSPLNSIGRWHFWIYAVMNDTRILIGEVANRLIYEEGKDKQ